MQQTTHRTSQRQLESGSSILITHLRKNKSLHLTCNPQASKENTRNLGAIGHALRPYNEEFTKSLIFTKKQFRKTTKIAFILSE